jgi:UDP-N-acetyl-D-glucosamine dehydrogenase
MPPTAAAAKPNKFVIGMQRPSTRSFWKIPYLNRGVAPVEAEDPEVAPMIRRCVLEKQTLMATYTYDVLSLADVVVVDVQCDYLKESMGNVRQGHADIAALESSLKVIGQKIDPGCLVLIETTVPPGTTEYVAYPIIKKAFEQRGWPTNRCWRTLSSASCPGATMSPPSVTSGACAAASTMWPATRWFAFSPKS